MVVVVVVVEAAAQAVLIFFNPKCSDVVVFQEQPGNKMVTATKNVSSPLATTIFSLKKTPEQHHAQAFWVGGKSNH